MVDKAIVGCLLQFHEIAPTPTKNTKLVDERCKELHEAGLIQPSSSDFAATTVMPTKNNSVGLWTEKRMCGDYRPLNLVTPQNRYPMPIPQELFDSIGDLNIFTIVDLRQGF